MSHRLDPLLRPRSIAVVGASRRKHTVGNYVVGNLTHGGYGGSLYAVNPGYDDVLGVGCYPALDDLPSPVEHVIFAIGDERIEAALEDAIAHGAKAVTIVSSLVMADDTEPPLNARVRRIAEEAGLLVCGANCMGFYNVTDRVIAGAFDTRRLEPPGNITYISHSGSGMCGIVDCDERLRFNLVVTTGQELTVTLEDYLDFALDLDETEVVGLFLETSRKPDALLRAFEKANQRGVPIVAIKVGRTELSKQLTESHSGAMAGSETAFDAVFDRYGVQRVDDMDELATALMMFAQPHPLGDGGLASIHDSGGERQLTIDLGDGIGVPFAALSEDSTRQLAEQLDPGLEAVNPLDAWSAGGERSDEIMCECFAAMMADPATAFGAVIHDRAPYSRIYPEYCEYLRAGHAASGKPAFLVASRQGTGSDPLVVETTHAGFPVLDGLKSFLRGAKCLLDFRDFGRRREGTPPSLDFDSLGPWRDELNRGETLGEARASALLDKLIVMIARSLEVDSKDEAVIAAAQIGYPVVLKTADPDISHKSDHGGVQLGLRSPDDVVAAYRSISARLGGRVVVAEQVRPGPELILGMHNDPQFGPIVMLGAGGIRAETDVDATWALAPFGEATARRMLDRLRMRPVLDGIRGARPADIESICRATARLSVVSHQLRDIIASIDINPVIAHEDGCVAVDALIIPRKKP